MGLVLMVGNNEGVLGVRAFVGMGGC